MVIFVNKLLDELTLDFMPSPDEKSGDCTEPVKHPREEYGYLGFKSENAWEERDK